MAPSPTGTASCMYCPRRRTVRRASAKDSVPAATCAAYSPRLWPAANDARSPRDSTSRQAATLTARIAGCVFSVSWRRSAGPSKHSALSDSPSAASASANVSRQMSNREARRLPHADLLRTLTGKDERDHDGRDPDGAPCDDFARQADRRAADPRSARPCGPRCAPPWATTGRDRRCRGRSDRAAAHRRTRNSRRVAGSGETPGARGGSRRACRTSTTAPRAAALRPSRPGPR